VQSVRSLWIDLDVGVSEEGKPAKHATQSDAIAAVGRFVKQTGLPIPMILSSGTGVHVYWPMTEDLMPGQWHAAAVMLKALCAAEKCRLISDPTRTADMASVLRPVGTHNRKGGQARPVALLHDAGPFVFTDLFHTLEKACKANAAPVPAAPKVAEPGVNDKFLIKTDYPDSSAELIGERCQQVRAMRDRGGDVPEPIWYGAIQVLFHTVESRDVIHRWSSGYAGYSPAETEKKIEQIAGYGPTNCKTFEDRNPDGCVGCPFKGKIVSPIQLGVQVKALPAPVIETAPGVAETRIEIPNPPAPFIRSKEGVFVEIDGGAQTKIYDYDLFPIELSWDEHLGYETAKIRHHLPHEGWMEFGLPTYLLESQRDFGMHLRKHHIKATNGRLLNQYMDGYLKELQKRRQIRKLFVSMGWKEDNRGFVLGDRLFQQDGTVVEAGSSVKLSGAIDGIKSRGEIGPWVEGTKELGVPGREAHAFTLLLGFGAPLVELTGYFGMVFSMFGETNSGKSTMGKYLTSIYGDYQKMQISYKWTEQAKFERIGIYCNLPCYVDEGSMLAPEEVSKLCYEMSQGEGRKRLKTDGTERQAANWRTLLVTSTNQRLQSKLESAKTQAKAESVRLFEYEVPKLPDFEQACKHLNPMLTTNYGVAGPIFIDYVVRNSYQIRQDIRAMQDAIATAANCQGEERFWVNGAACALVGGMIAYKLGLLRFEIAPVFKWVIETIRGMRRVVQDAQMDDVALIANYFDEHAGHRLNVRKADLGDGRENWAVIGREPFGALLHRLERDQRTIFVNRKHVKDWMVKKGEDPATVSKALIAKGILSPGDTRKVLGAGTALAGGQVQVWKLSLKHPAFSDMLQAVDIEEKQLQQGVDAT